MTLEASIRRSVFYRTVLSSYPVKYRFPTTPSWYAATSTKKAVQQIYIYIKIAIVTRVFRQLHRVSDTSLAYCTVAYRSNPSSPSSSSSAKLQAGYNNRAIFSGWTKSSISLHHKINGQTQLCQPSISTVHTSICTHAAHH